MRRDVKLVRLVLFAMYGALMFVMKFAMEAFPNIHPLSMLVMTFTVVYGLKALIPIYIYVFLNGIFGGFNLWWIPYLYLWALQCLITLLIPRSIDDRWAAVVYPLLCAFFGLTFGLLYAPAQAIMFGLTPAQTLAWILAGIKFDVIHMVSNFFMGMLVLPLSKVLKQLHKSMRVPLN